MLLQGAFIVPEVQSATIQYLRQDLEMGVEQGEFNVDIDLLLVNQFISLIRSCSGLSDMSDETIKSTCRRYFAYWECPQRMQITKSPRLASRFRGLRWKRH